MFPEKNLKPTFPSSNNLSSITFFKSLFGKSADPYFMKSSSEKFKQLNLMMPMDFYESYQCVICKSNTLMVGLHTY